MQKLKLIPYPESVSFLGGFAEKSNELKIIKNLELVDSCSEAYELIIEKNEIKINAASEAGLFFAEQTLNQLLMQDEIPCVIIKDKPKYKYRSFMIDSVRHMQTIDEIKRIIKAASLFKMNVFHWHLTDDQGFRIESEKYPLLNKIGSFRKRSDFGNTHINEVYGGYYTKAEMRDVVRFANEHFIEVIPEIEIPGHTLSILSTFPELSCRGVPIDVGTMQGIFPDILCAGNEETFSFVFGMLDEIIEIFNPKRIHIGGDEAPKKRWKECKKCQAKKNELGYSDEDELQGWLVNRIADYLSEKGIEAIVWNESLKGNNLNKSIIAQRWMDKDSLTETYANGGGKVVLSDFYHYYLDYPYSMTPLSKTYNYDPVSLGKFNSVGKENVIGIEAPIWTEYISDFEKLCYSYFPRFLAVAEAAWSKKENMDYEAFLQSYKMLVKMLYDLRIFPAPLYECNPNIFKRISKTAKFFSNAFSPELIKRK